MTKRHVALFSIFSCLTVFGNRFLLGVNKDRHYIVIENNLKTLCLQMALVSWSTMREIRR